MMCLLEILAEYCVSCLVTRYASQVRTETAVFIGQSLAISIADFYDQESTFKTALSNVLGIPTSRIITVR